MDGKTARRLVTKEPFHCPNCGGGLILHNVNTPGFTEELRLLMAKYPQNRLQLIPTEDAEKLLRSGNACINRH